MKKILIILIVIGLANTVLGAGNTLPALAYGESIEFGLDLSFRSLNLSNDQTETTLDAFYEGLHFASKIKDFQYQIHAGLTQYTTTSFGFFAGLNPRYDFWTTFFDAGNQYILFLGGFNLLYTFDAQLLDSEVSEDLQLLELRVQVGAIYGKKSWAFEIYAMLDAGALLLGYLSGEAVDFAASPFFGLTIGARKVVPFGLHWLAFRLEVSFFREFMISASIALLFKQTYEL